jgi:hypothetical protein
MMTIICIGGSGILFSVIGVNITTPLRCIFLRLTAVLAAEVF